MKYDKRKMIFENKEKQTTYYIAGFSSKSDFTWAKDVDIFYLSDILLEGKTHKGFWKTEFAFFSFHLWKVYQELGKETYTFEQFKKDIEEFGNPKFCIIYAKRPPRKFRPKTQAEKDADEQMMMAASYVNTGFL